MTNSTFNWKTASIFIGMTIAFIAPVTAQTYKWIGPDGKVNYSDRPPPAGVDVQTKRKNDGDANQTQLPYEVLTASKKNPVTLYTAPNCSPCDSARQHLRFQGIPFTEKTVSTDLDFEAMKKAGGTTQLPFLLVGSKKYFGFQKEDWEQSLKAAGYPETSKLPPSYRWPAAVAAAPVEVPKDSNKAGGDEKPNPTVDRPSRPAPIKDPQNKEFRF